MVFEQGRGSSAKVEGVEDGKIRAIEGHLLLKSIKPCIDERKVCYRIKITVRALCFTEWEMDIEAGI
jgi:hypothetical protein